MTLYLVRHGETEWNVQRRLQGHSDSPLTELGLSQVHAYGELLSGLLQAAHTEICASPLPRTLRTASLLAARLGIAAERCRQSELLRERYCGAWEGLNFEELATRHGREETQRLWRDWNARIGGDGETLAEMHARARSWLAQPRASATTVIVTHGIMSRVLRGTYLSLEPTAIAALPSHKQQSIFRLADGCVTELSSPAGVGRAD